MGLGNGYVRIPKLVSDHINARIFIDSACTSARKLIFIITISSYVVIHSGKRIYVKNILSPRKT